MRNRKFRAFVLAGGIWVLAVIGTEFLLRVFVEALPSYAQRRIDALYTGNANDPGWSIPDDELGFVGRPLRHDIIETIDFSFTAETDEHGFANAGPWPDRADIVFLGDSLLTGVGVGIGSQFTTLVAEQLPSYSVINLGLPGAAPEQQFRIFRRFGAQLQPKLVVACLYVASDIENAKTFDAWLNAGRQWSYDEFRKSHYPETLAKILEKDDRATNETAKNSTEQSGFRLREFIRRAIFSTAIGAELIYHLDPWRKGLLHEVKWADGSKVFLFARFQNQLARGIDDDYPSISKVFFDPLVKLQTDVESTGGIFLVVLIPSKEEIFAAAGFDNRLRIVTEVRKKLDELGMTVLDIYPAITETGRTMAPFFPHDIHLNEAGNVAASNAIADWINRSRVLSGH